MSTGVQAYPLAWPSGRPRSKYRNNGNFGRNLSIAKARDQVYHELRMHGTTACVISSDLILNLDGTPRGSQSQPADTGVAVYFTMKKEPHVIACDHCYRVEHNIRAIAMTIEAQRGILRWGAVTAEQIFAGFKALPGPVITPARMTIDEAAQFVGHVASMSADDLVKSREQFDAAYRKAARELHPDANGGDVSEHWGRLQEAAALLEQHHARA